MKWREKSESKKKMIPVVLALLVCAVLLCACAGSNPDPDMSAGEAGPAIYPEGAYIATVTYVVSLPDGEQMTFVLEAAPSGKAVVPPDIEDTDNTIWSGWLTEDGEVFDMNTVLTEDLTLYGIYYADENNNHIADGSPEDPITVYQFQHTNGFTLLVRKFFGQNAAFDYTAPEYAYPESEGDGYIFLGWIESQSVSNDGGTVTVCLTPELAPDRNNNNLVDGSDEDRFVYHVFLAQDGTVLQEVQWLAGDEEVRADDVACPTTISQKLVGWDRTESKDADGNTVYTYTPDIMEE